MDREKVICRLAWEVRKIRQFFLMIKPFMYGTLAAYLLCPLCGRISGRHGGEGQPGEHPRKSCGRYEIRLFGKMPVKYFVKYDIDFRYEYLI